MTIIWCLLILGQVNNPTLSSKWVHDAYLKKYSIAKEKDSNQRLIFIGGSSLLFGLDTKLIEDTFHIPAVNFGVNAGLLLPYHLYAAKKVLKKGDIAIMALEYPMYNHDGKLNEQIIDYTLAYDPDFFNFLTLKEKLYLISHVTLSRLIDGYKKTGLNVKITGLYGAHNIDNNGDQLNTTAKDQTPALKQELLNHKPQTYGKDFNKKALAWKYLIDFENWADTNNIKLIFVPVPFLKRDVYFTDKIERNFYSSLPSTVSSYGFLYLGNPYDFMYDIEYFFNTDYHLKAEYKEIYTTSLINLLRPHIPNPSALIHNRSPREPNPQFFAQRNIIPNSSRSEA